MRATKKALAVLVVLLLATALAVAGGEGSLNPVKVVQRIVEMFPSYIMIVLYLVPFIMLPVLLAALVMVALVQVSPVVGQFVGQIVGGVANQYVAVSACAMLGLMLRKHKTGQPSAKGEWLVGLAWVGGAVGAAVLLGVLFVTVVVAQLAAAGFDFGGM